MWYHAFAWVKALREELKDRPGFPVVILVAGNKDAESVEILKKYIPDRGKISPRRITGTCAFHQRKLSLAVKRARLMALLPYVED